jgi:hypothetical protein
MSSDSDPAADTAASDARDRDDSGANNDGFGADRAEPLALAAGYVRATRLADGDPASFRRSLADLDPEQLRRVLDGDDATLAFWLNVYNASVQDHLARTPRLFDADVLGRRPIFTRDLVTIAGERLSVDDVEHGILRRSQQAWGLGYLPRLRPSAFERTHRVDAIDPRIHFALNCGARSCPPVLAYDPARVDDQLDAATRSYLETEVEYDPDTGVAHVPKLFSWYRGDFGGKSGICAFLREHDAVPADVTPSLAWRDYDWTLKLGTYADHDA